MRKELKAQIIENIAAQLEETPSFYVTDIAGLNAEVTAKLRRACFEKEIKLLVVKNTLFYKVLEQRGIENLEQFGEVLRGSSAIMFTTVANSPARLKSSLKRMKNLFLRLHSYKIVLTLALTNLILLLASSLVRNLSVTSLACCRLLHKMLSQLLLHRAVVKLQVS